MNVGCAKCGATDIPLVGHEPCPGPAPVAICHDWESEMIAREYLPPVCPECGLWLKAFSTTCPRCDVAS